MKTSRERFLTVALVSSLCCLFAAVNAGCGVKAADEPTKYRSQEGLEKLTAQAAASAPDNPAFLLAKDRTSGSPNAQDIDSIIRPVLARSFKDAKLVSATGPEAPKRDGEVVEDRLVYVVKATVTEADGDKLRSAFEAARFPASPRLGRKPTHSRGNVYMSLFKSTSRRGYSFVVIVDTNKQRIQVESYKLGSKYDRLM